MRTVTQFSATEEFQEWVRRMGHDTDKIIHAKEAYGYSDVAGERWKDCWTHGDGKVPVRVLVMGTSVKLGHSASADEFRLIMLDKFGFAAEQEESDLTVRFFEDSLEDIPGAVTNLMER